MIGQDTTSLFRIEHLFKSFQGQIVLNDISLRITPKSILGILGPNGAGKTTLLRIISGLLSIDSGKIEQKSSGLGYCPQSPVFWKKLNCYEQLKFNSDLFLIPKKQASERIHFLMEKLGLTRQMKTAVERLSGGMQKRLNLAMALVNKPDLLVLDEPTANLDLESKEYVRKLLQYLVREEEVTVLCSSHDLDEISILSDEVLFMDKGKILHREEIKSENQSDSTYSHLKKLYAELMASQETK